MEIDEIHLRVQQLRERAAQLGLPELALDFYRDFVRFSPGWNKSARDLIPESVTVGDSGSSTNVVLEYQGHCFGFEWKEQQMGLPDATTMTLGELSILAEGTLVFELGAHLLADDDDDGAGEWSPGEVGGFIEGPWIGALRSLAAECAEAERRKRERDGALARQTEAEDLKRKFGL